MMKMRRFGLACALALASTSDAAHFDAVLTAAAGGVTRKAGMDETPPLGGFNKRPILQARAGEPIRIEFIMTNVYTHDAFIDSGVRYYIVKEREAGQKPVPPLEG